MALNNAQWHRTEVSQLSFTTVSIAYRIIRPAAPTFLHYRRH
jgi:hypothetical protein